MSPRRWLWPGLASLAIHGGAVCLAFGLFAVSNAPRIDPVLEIELVVVAPRETTTPVLAPVPASTPARHAASMPAAPHVSESLTAPPPLVAEERPAVAPPVPPLPKRRPGILAAPETAPRASDTAQRPPIEVPVAASGDAPILASLGSDEREPAARFPAPDGSAPSGATDARPRTGNPPPDYPMLARRNGIEGRVIVRVVVGITGAADAVSVARSSGSVALDDAALRALARWRFEPAQLSGVPIASAIDVPVLFRLEAR